jgi:hypothetical protein
MSNALRHVLGISGGKDSAALAIYLRHKHPELDIEYYFCDTGKELQETYALISNLENYLGKKITRLEAAPDSPENSFDHFVKVYGGYLPSSSARWCTKKLKLEPFEHFVGNDPVVSYVGIRGDEDREGYISRKPNIQSIFPFRRNIWSEDVVQKLLKADALPQLRRFYQELSQSAHRDKLMAVVEMPLSRGFTQAQKLNALLDADVRLFNQVVFAMLRDTSYPLALADSFPLLDNEDNLIRADIFLRWSSKNRQWQVLSSTAHAQQNTSERLAADPQEIYVSFQSGVRAPSGRWGPANRRGPRPGPVTRLARPLAAPGVSRGRAEQRGA